MKRKCSKCGKRKLLALFYRRGSGHRSECAACNRADMIKRRSTLGLVRL